MSAKLRIRPAPEAGDDAQRVEVDCRHARTEAWLIPGRQGVVTLDDIVRYVLLRHFGEEGCGCTVGLRYRYGLLRGRDE